MALQESGEIKLLDIAYEFDGVVVSSTNLSPNIQLTDYYGVASGVPTSGQIKISDFYGKQSGLYNGVIDQSFDFRQNSMGQSDALTFDGDDSTRATFSAWIKLTRDYRTDGTNQSPVVGGIHSGIFSMTKSLFSNFASIELDKEGHVYVNVGNGDFFNPWGATYTTKRILRDTNAWYHIVVVWDANLSNWKERIKIYINGALQDLNYSGSDWGTGKTYSWNKKDSIIYVGGSPGWYAQNYWEGYMSEVHYLDGIALPSANAFGEEKNGGWIPRIYTGPHGSHGFYVDFSSVNTEERVFSGVAATIPFLPDISGNGQKFWGVNYQGALSLQPYQIVLDTPENNFCTLNYVDRNAGSALVLSEGNRKKNKGGNPQQTCGGTHGMSSGKYYWEVNTLQAYYDNGTNTADGIIDSERIMSASDTSSGVYVVYGYAGEKNNTHNYNTRTTHFSGKYVSGDIIQIAFDADNGKIWFGRNGSWYNNGAVDSSANPATGTNPAYSGINTSKTWKPHSGSYSTRYDHYMVYNFGQDSSFAGNKTAQGNTDGNGYGDFYYAPPSGFLALCSANLPLNSSMDPANGIIPEDHFKALTYTGNGTYNKTISVGFTPGITWTKERNGSSHHAIYDWIRSLESAYRGTSTWSGEDRFIYPDSPNHESYYGGNARMEDTRYSNNYTIKEPTFKGNDLLNKNGSSYVSWNWKLVSMQGDWEAANGSYLKKQSFSNGNGNFSATKYIGNGNAGARVKHACGVKPKMIIIKNLQSNYNWVVGHQSMTWNSYLEGLNNENTKTTHQQMFNNAEPTDTYFTLGYSKNVNANAQEHIAYCFAEVEGFSKFGTYQGNSSSDGTFVYTGFKPAFVMIKNVSDSTNWNIWDNARDPYNPSGKWIRANIPNSELDYNTSYPIDFLSNGFKFRHESGNANQSGRTYIFMAFAEYPFKYANAR